MQGQCADLSSELSLANWRLNYALTLHALFLSRECGNIPSSGWGPPRKQRRMQIAAPCSGSHLVEAVMLLHAVMARAQLAPVHPRVGEREVGVVMPPAPRQLPIQRRAHQ
jgi:hypothetical protein